MDFNFGNTLRDKPATDQLLASAKICLEALIRDSKSHGIKNFLKEPAKYSLALSLVTQNKYAEFSAPKANYKMLILVAEETGGQWVSSEFVCDLNGRNMQKVEIPGKEPVEPEALGLSTQAEIIFYERGHSQIASNRMARLEITTKMPRTSQKNVLDIYNPITKTSANYHVAVLQ